MTFGISRFVWFGEIYSWATPDPVIILDGVMAGYEAILSETVGKAHVVVLFQIADRQVRIETGHLSVQHV